MAVPIVDIEINEHETFEMELSYWENSDRSVPIDLSTWTFKGTFSFDSLCLPMTFITLNNSVVCRVEADVLVNLPIKGTYLIEVNDTIDIFRLQQGTLRVNKGMLCS